MRGHRRLFGALAAFVATLAVVCAVTGLAHAEPYKYTVRVFEGNRGKLSEDPVSVTVEKGGRVNLFDFAKADTSGSKYVQIGFRLTGTDKLLGNGVVNGITEDMDYVVAYGVKGETVAYTLKFVEYGTGKELASPQTYYGRIGDKPVAAYEYIEGYRPLYLTITGTLKENEDENVWTFEYVALQAGETIETTTTTTNTTSTTTPGNETVNYETVTEPGETIETTTTTTNTTSTTTPGNETVNYETVTEPGDVTSTTRTETVPGTTTNEAGTTTDGGTTYGGTTTTTNPGTTTGGTTTTNPTTTGTTTTTVVPITTGGGTTTTTTTAPSTTGGTTGGNAGGNAASNPSGAGGNEGPSNVAADAGASTAAGVNQGAGASESAPATRELLDMDNPLAGPSGETDTTGSGGDAAQAASRVNPFAIAILATAAVLATVFYFFWKRKKDEEDEPEPEE